MTIYLNDIKYYPANSSFLKSGAKTMVFYPAAAFILFFYYTNLGLPQSFYILMEEYYHICISLVFFLAYFLLQSF